MRTLAFKALETAHQDSIDLLAAALYSSNPVSPSYVLDDKNKVSEVGSADASRFLSQEDRIKQFRKTFDIVDDLQWQETMARGSVAMGKAGNEVIMEYSDCCKRQS
jgi:hypothetical protein